MNGTLCVVVGNKGVTKSDKYFILQPLSMTIVLRALVAILPAIGLVSCSCPRPPEIDNIVQYIGVDYQPLVSISNLRFDTGTVLTARCQDPTTQTFRGRRHRRCSKRNNKWTGKPPRCEPASLRISFSDELVTVSPVGTFVLPVTTPFVELFCTSNGDDLDGNLTMYMYGSELQPVVPYEDQRRISYNFTKPSGSQSGTLKCQLGGNSISKKLLFQERDDYCPDVSANHSDNFTVQYSAERKLGSLAYYTCADTFEQIGGSTERMCLGNHTWDRDPIVCVPGECGTNMVFANCTNCQRSCSNPGGECENNCNEKNERTCICPAEGYLMNGDECLRPEECGCYFEGKGVIAEGDRILNNDCTQICSCRSNTLQCFNYSCHVNAECMEVNDTRQCVCRDGFEGINCTATITGAPDCTYVYEAGYRANGVYYISPRGWSGDPFPVYCNMSFGGGWTVIQRRQDGSENFNRTWSDYKNGFGSLDGNMWLGNEKIRHISWQDRYDLRIDLVTQSGVNQVLINIGFRISGEESSYILHVSRNSGNREDYMSYHTGRLFSTYDNNGGSNCAVTSGGGWWYLQTYICYTANLNGEYGSAGNTTIGLRYPPRQRGFDEINLRFTEMKIRRRSRQRF